MRRMDLELTHEYYPCFQVDFFFGVALMEFRPSKLYQLSDAPSVGDISATIRS